MTVQCIIFILHTFFFQLTLRTDGILFLDEPGVVAGLGVTGDGAFLFLILVSP